MHDSYDSITQRCREMISRIPFLAERSFVGLFPDWIVYKASCSFDTTGNDYCGMPIVIQSNPTGGPVWTSGDGDTTEELLDRWKFARSHKGSTAELLSITYALHLHCL